MSAMGRGAPILPGAFRLAVAACAGPVSTTERSYRHIVRTPGVRGGHARVEGTRLAVHDVIGLRQTGETVDTLIARCTPDLTRAQVFECLAYYEEHRGEIDVLVARQMSPADRGPSSSTMMSPTICASADSPRTPRDIPPRCPAPRDA
jgi:uncharacterized protein (DUF433 family)